MAKLLFTVRTFRSKKNTKFTKS